MVRIAKSALLFALVGCSPEPSSPRPQPAAPVVDSPVIAGPTLVTGPAPLAVAVALEADRPVFLELTVTGGGRRQVLVSTDAAATHELPVLLLRPASAHTIEVAVLDTTGHRTELPPLSHTTAALPGDMPRIEVLAHDRAAMEPGLTLFDLKLAGPFDAWVVALDEDLDVAWYLDEQVGDLRRTASGTLFGLVGERAVELDVLGRELRSFAPIGRDGTIPVEVTGFHHEAWPRDDGGFVTLGTAIRAVPSYPPSYEDPSGDAGPAQILDHTLLSIGPDGAVESAWSLAEQLDTHHIGWDSLDVLGETPEGEPIYDWGHANAAVVRDDGFLVSLRHQDAIVRLEADGALRWILAEPVGWDPSFDDALLAPIGAPVWPLHQHAPAFTEAGDLVVFDNRKDGAGPYAPVAEPELASRIVAWRISEEARTVEALWTWEPQVAVYSPALGDADPLPITGNVLATFGFVTHEGGVANLDADRGYQSVRLIELDPAAPEPVLDLRISTERDVDLFGCTTYRADRIDTLYPPSVTVLE